MKGIYGGIMSYVLENLGETERLEAQEKIESYNIRKDINGISFNTGETLLDAGCGSGLISRFLKDEFPGLKVEACDSSKERIHQARELSGKYDISFYVSELEKIDRPQDTYHKIICRFVFEYLPQPQTVANELHRICKPGGQVCLIDVDGLLFNLSTHNYELQSYLKKLEIEFYRDHHLDLFAGRKLFSFMKKPGFKNINYNIRTMKFNDRDLKLEKENYIQRFNFAHSLFESVLGKDTERFKALYLAELENPCNLIFYNNFSVVGEK